MHDVGKIVKFKGESQLDVFDDDKCNVINGTDELFFGPFMEQDDVEYAYEFQACTSFSFHYKELTNIKGHKAVRKTMKPLDAQVTKCLMQQQSLKLFPRYSLDQRVTAMNILDVYRKVW